MSSPSALELESLQSIPLKDLGCRGKRIIGRYEPESAKWFHCYIGEVLDFRKELAKLLETNGIIGQCDHFLFHGFEFLHFPFFPEIFDGEIPDYLLSK